MAIRTVVTRGFGNGTFSGTIALVVLRGYGAAVIPPPAVLVLGDAGVAAAALTDIGLVTLVLDDEGG